jgi:hypothetical protein
LGIDNTPDAATIENLKQLCIHTLEPLRVLIGKPLSVDSGFRCEALNAAVGGAKDSQHKLGEAADILPPAGMTNEELFEITAKNIPFDQLIQEGTWVHASYREVCRGQMLQATFIEGKAHYTPRFINR